MLLIFVLEKSRSRLNSEQVGDPQSVEKSKNVPEYENFAPPSNEVAINMNNHTFTAETVF
jgi:hypothetical protein